MPFLESAALALIMGFFHVNTEEKTTFAYEHPQKSIKLFGVFFLGVGGVGDFFLVGFWGFFSYQEKTPSTSKMHSRFKMSLQPSSLSRAHPVHELSSSPHCGVQPGSHPT